MRGRWVVRLPSWLGDTIMAVPTIRALERAVDELTLWGSDQHCRLLRATGVRAGALAWSRRRGVAAIADVIAGARQLAELKPQGVVLLPNAFEPALTAALARVRRRIGYATDTRSWLLTDPVTPPDAFEPLHDGDRYAGLLSTLNIDPPHAEDVLLEMPRAALQRARTLLGDHGPLLGIVPGCANDPAKRWPAASYAALAERMAERWGAVTVILGGPQDRVVAGAIEAACGRRCINLAGRTNILELAAILRLCRAVVSNDTGAAHLAAALSCPTLVVFGPTDPRRTRPRGPHVRIASIGAFCQPCLAKVCPLDHRCMTGLTPDLVASSLDPLWRGFSDQQAAVEV